MNAVGRWLRRRVPSTHSVDAAGLGACVLVLALAYLVGLAPRLRERAEAVQERADLDSGRREMARLKEERRARETAEAAIRATIESGTVHPSSARDVNQRVQSIVELSEQCGLRISEISPGTPAAGGRIVVVPIKVRGTGGYSPMTDLISRLHERHPDTAVSAMTLSGSAAGDLPAEFSVEFAWYTAPDGAGRAEAPPPAK